MGKTCAFPMIAIKQQQSTSQLQRMTFQVFVDRMAVYHKIRIEQVGFVVIQWFARNGVINASTQGFHSWSKTRVNVCFSECKVKKFQRTSFLQECVCSELRIGFMNIYQRSTRMWCSGSCDNNR